MDLTRIIREQFAGTPGRAPSLDPEHWGSGPLLAGVSGGCDSMALLHALHLTHNDLGLRLHVVHVDHGVRAESVEDAAFVAEQAAGLGLPCEIERVDVVGRLQTHHEGLEGAARAERLQAFQRVAARTGARAIALAHTRDDDLETFLMRLLGGASLTNLASLEPERREGELWLLRPLLGVSREALEAWARERGIVWRDDPSNADTALLRNRVRHQLLPLLATGYNPRIAKTLGHTLDELKLLRAESPGEHTEPILEPSTNPLVVPLEGIARLTDRERWALWAACCKSAGVPGRALTRSHLLALDRLVATHHGAAELHLPGGIRARREYAQLSFRCVPDAPDPIQREVPITALPHRTQAFAGWVLSVGEGEEHAGGSEEAGLCYTANLAREPQVPWRWRTRRPGDRLALPGGGHATLKEWFIDRKIPRSLRASWPVLARESGEALWTPGFAGPGVGSDAPFLSVRAWRVGETTRGHIS